MTRTTLAVLLAAAVAPTADLAAQDESRFRPVLGAWEMTMETPRGSFTQQLTFMVEQGTLKGTVSSQRGTTALKNLTFADGKLEFDLERTMGERTMSQHFTAMLEGDVLKGTMSGGRGGERPFEAKRKAT